MMYTSEAQSVPLRDCGPYFLPENLAAALERYRDFRCPPGGYMEAVLRNDFAGAVLRADLVSEHYFKEILWFIRANLPRESFGTADAVYWWIHNTSGGR